MNDHTRIVVLGGGYAGVLAANRLQRADTDVALVNPRPQFVERIRLHQLAADNDDAVESFDALLGEGVRLVVDGAERIDAAARRVELTSGATIDYDYLVYAVGSTGSVPAGVPGAAEYAYPLSELEQAHRLRSRLADVALSAPIVVVGGGLTGIEAATEFAEAGRRVTLVTDVLGATLSAGGRRSVCKVMARLAVDIVEGAAVARVTADGVELADGTHLPSAVTVWTAGFRVPGLAAASGLTTDALGRLLTDETLTSVDDPRIVAAGDAAAPSGLPLRMSCQAALPLGAQAAETVLRRIEGAEPARINQAFTGQCISLGRDAGTIQLARFDDSVLPLYIGGRVAATIKEQVCKGTLAFLRKEARKPGTYFWLKGGKRQEKIPMAVS
ncbi:NAD(P)/FAD-dependent oxidoreductase [Mycolicibacterium sp. F2034L]|uniref:NAD(P)/FAD-dependent oxidoreductase n=1 Tax=Mycolicibacterium sp. F2034L TaxID=2926422 RepID=UPI001FF56F90|nr:FAD-dependent oxidoreductase [Mycolicibacterium sp. F2034L]MCK0172847.1 FAD-dependent oxidoreductase [Mycolicibacterium sp. F2034L]